MTCKNCGALNPDTNAVCINCGAKLSENAQGVNQDSRFFQGVNENNNNGIETLKTNEVNIPPIMNNNQNVNNFNSMNNMNSNMNMPNYGVNNATNINSTNNNGNKKFILVIILIVVLLVVVAVGSFFIGKSLTSNNDNNNSENNQSNVDNTNEDNNQNNEEEVRDSISVSVAGITYEIPNQYEYQVNSDMLLVMPADESWGVYFTPFDVPYTSILAKQDELRDNATDSLGITNVTVEETVINDLDCVKLSGIYLGVDTTILMTRFNSSQSIMSLILDINGSGEALNVATDIVKTATMSRNSGINAIQDLSELNGVLNDFVQ